MDGKEHGSSISLIRVLSHPCLLPFLSFAEINQQKSPLTNQRKRIIMINTAHKNPIKRWVLDETEFNLAMGFHNAKQMIFIKKYATILVDPNWKFPNPGDWDFQSVGLQWSPTYIFHLSPVDYESTAAFSADAFGQPEFSVCFGSEWQCWNL